MNDLVFHIIFTIALLGVYGIRLASWRAAIRSGDQVEYKESKLNMAVRGILGLLWNGALLAYVVYPRYLAWAVFPLPAWARWIGVALSLAAVPLLGWVQWTLGRNFSTTLHVRERHTLVMHGPYRWVRHPMYTALFMFLIGLLLLTANWVVGAPGIVTPIFLLTRIGNEETMMIEQFGDEYREYMKRTGRFLPRLGR